MNQLALEFPAQRARRERGAFDGETYEADSDFVRLTGQMQLVHQCMSDYQWRTLAEIRSQIGVGSETGISARLRDLRKDKWGSHQVDRRRRGDGQKGLFEYRLILRQ